MAGGNIRREGPTPVNPHGGNLAEVCLHGSTRLLEGVRQLRGTSWNQIARVGVALYGSGVGASAETAASCSAVSAEPSRLSRLG